MEFSLANTCKIVSTTSSHRQVAASRFGVSRRLALLGLIGSTVLGPLACRSYREVARWTSPDEKADAVLSASSGGATSPKRYQLVLDSHQNPGHKTRVLELDNPMWLEVRWVAPRLLQISHEGAEIRSFTNVWSLPEDPKYIVEAKLESSYRLFTLSDRERRVSRQWTIAEAVLYSGDTPAWKSENPRNEQIHPRFNGTGEVSIRIRHRTREAVLFVLRPPERMDGLILERLTLTAGETTSVLVNNEPRNVLSQRLTLPAPIDPIDPAGQTYVLAFLARDLAVEETEREFSLDFKLEERRYVLKVRARLAASERNR